jgi:hypothetical protein
MRACDPLAPSMTALSVIVAIGRDPQGTVYVVDQPRWSRRVFVAKDDDTLYRKHVVGGFTRGGPSDADYVLPFEEPDRDAASTRSLLVQVRGGFVTAMALGLVGSFMPISDTAPGQLRLTLLDRKVVQGMRVVDLPRVVQRVADVSDGNAIIATQPMDDPFTEDTRLFYGAPNDVVERRVVSYGQSLNGDASFSFLVDDIKAFAHFPIVPPVDGGAGGPGPGTLKLGDGQELTITPRLPTPRNLNGFTFRCFVRSGG